jgi:uncharacterized protein (DUF2147 family)
MTSTYQTLVHRVLGMTLLAILLFVTNVDGVRAQNADAIVGRWYTENDRSIIEIWKAGSTFSGKVVWARDSADEKGQMKLDKNNPNAALRSRVVVGSQIMSEMKFIDGEWQDGKIYDPESGNIYSCKAKMVGQNLELRGYVMGLPFLGRSQMWRRDR